MNPAYVVKTFAKVIGLFLVCCTLPPLIDFFKAFAPEDEDKKKRGGYES